jgi:hypothetical protein
VAAVSVCSFFPHYQHLLKETGGYMNINLGLTPLVSLLAGILILVAPRMLNYIVAIYLIIIGLIGIFGAGSLHLR